MCYKRPTFRVTQSTQFCLLMVLAAVMLFLPLIVMAQNVKTFIPAKAYSLVPDIVVATNKNMPGFAYPQFFSAQAEQESCISLTHKRCLDPTAELKTSREQGVGIGQITRAYRADGTVRFDVLTDLRYKYPGQLKELSWDTVKQRPDLQVTALVLLFNEGYRSFSTVKRDYQRIAMAAASYNGGIGSIQDSRRLCGVAKGCDPQYWFGNVERYSTKSTKPIYGTRSPRDINLEYPALILGTRIHKYDKLYADLGHAHAGLGLKPF